MSSATTLAASDRGSILLTVMMFVGFMTLTIVMIAKVSEEKTNAQLKAKLMDSRSLVMTAALRNARVATYYYKTITTPAPGLDPAFVACMIGDGVTPLCNEGGPPRPLLLIDDSAAGIPVIKGSPATPVYYDIYGRICILPPPPAPAPIGCAFEVWAVYNVKCPRSGSPCIQASTIDIAVTVQPIASVYPNHLPRMLPITSTETVAISNFMDFINPAFPPVSFVAGTPGNQAQGAPISGNSGPAGAFGNYIEPFSSSGLCIDSYACSGSCTCVYTGAMGGGGGGGSVGTTTMSACPAGSQSVNGVCTAFNF